MPAPVGRDLDLTREQLERWLASVLPGDADEIEVGPLSGPGATGFSSDTLLFDLRYLRAGQRVVRGLVVRIEPQGFQLFPEYDLQAQYRILRALAGTDVPVPGALWQERDAEPIGAPFYVMEKVEGRIPADNPPYTAEGWVKRLSPEAQGAMWQSYLETLAAIHRLDVDEHDLRFLAKPELGETPLDQELAYYERFYRWAYGDGPHPVVEPSLAWLRENRPPAANPLRLCWGDARIGNMIFRDDRCVAVLDWEMARIGDPVMDLAWGLFLDRYHSEGNDVPRLPGFPAREEAIATYESLTGLGTEHLPYYEVLAGMRFSVILIRLAKQLKYYEFMPADVAFEIDNPVANLHRKQLGELGIL